MDQVQRGMKPRPPLNDKAVSEARRNKVYLAMTLPKSPSGNGGLPANQQTT